MSVPRKDNGYENEGHNGGEISKNAGKDGGNKLGGNLRLLEECENNEHKDAAVRNFLLTNALKINASETNREHENNDSREEYRDSLSTDVMVKEDHLQGMTEVEDPGESEKEHTGEKKMPKMSVVKLSTELKPEKDSINTEKVQLKQIPNADAHQSSLEMSGSNDTEQLATMTGYGLPVPENLSLSDTCPMCKDLGCNQGFSLLTNLHCSCNVFCAMRGHCCADFRTECPLAADFSTFLQNMTPNQTCISNDYLAGGWKSYYMIDTCPPESKEDCTTDETGADGVRFPIPAIGSFKETMVHVYANVKCALCNGETEIHTMRFVTNCTIVHRNDLSEAEYSFILSEDCSLEIIHQFDHTDVCIPNTMLENSGCTDGPPGIVQYLHAGNKIFRNRHCASPVKGKTLLCGANSTTMPIDTEDRKDNRYINTLKRMFNFKFQREETRVELSYSYSQTNSTMIVNKMLVLQFQVLTNQKFHSDFGALNASQFFLENINQSESLERPNSNDFTLIYTSSLDSKSEVLSIKFIVSHVVKESQEINAIITANNQTVNVIINKVKGATSINLVCGVLIKSDVQDYDKESTEPTCAAQIFKPDEVFTSNSSIVLRNNNVEIPDGQYFWVGENVHVCESDLKKAYYASQLLALRLESDAMGLLTTIMLSLSVAGFIGRIALHPFVPVFWTTTHRLQMNFCISQCSAFLLFLLSPLTSNIAPLCYTIGVLIHWNFIVSIIWTSVISWYMFKTFKNMNSQSYQLRTTCDWFKIMACVFGPPTAIVLCSVSLDFIPDVDVYFKPQYGAPGCWMGGKFAHLLLFGIPILCPLLFNLALYIAVVYYIHHTISITSNIIDRPPSYEVYLYVKLGSIIGLTWLFGFLGSAVDHAAVWYIFIVLCGLQGVFIFFAFVCTQQVWQSIRGRYRSHGPTTPMTRSHLTFREVVARTRTLTFTVLTATTTNTVSSSSTSRM